MPEGNLYLIICVYLRFLLTLVNETSTNTNSLKLTKTFISIIDYNCMYGKNPIYDL